MKLTTQAKNAILDCFENVVWTSDEGQTYIDALRGAFFPLISISAVYTQSGTVTTATPLDDLRDDLVVTANYDGGTTEVVSDYLLSGVLTAGTSTVTVTYSGKTTTFTVTVTEVDNTLYSWDFTQSLTDTKQGQVATISTGVTQSSAGLTFTGSNGCCLLGNVFPPGRTLEVDIASMTYNLSGHGRLVMFGDTSTSSVTANVGNGFILRNVSPPAWAFYKGAWSASYSTDKELFSGKKLILKYYQDGSQYKTDVYCDSTLIASYSNGGKWNTTTNQPVQIGSGQNAYKNMVITGIRIKEGV